MVSQRWWAAVAILAALFALIYLPALGHGFVRDDFHWIASARVRSFADAARLFSSNTGFYRPLVTLSFAADSAIWGVDPRGFAFTNLLLLVADAALLFAFARQLAMPPAGALFAASVWAFNFHGINVALLWTSGRTSLLLCLFALAAMMAFLRVRWLLTGLLVFAALLSKEEAVMLPPLLCAIDVAEHRNLRGTLRHVWPAFIALAIYAALRIHSGAFGPLNAPPFYRLTWQPHDLRVNVTEYLDRGATWPLVAALVTTAAAWPWRPLDAKDRRVLRIGLLWFAAMYAITLFVAIRSSLYAVAPSLGSSLIAGMLAAHSWRAQPRRFALAVTTLIAIVAAAIPIYRVRNAGLVEPAELSARSVIAIQKAAGDRGNIDSIVLIDDRHAPITLGDAFGALVPDAVHLFVDPGTTGEIVSSRAAAPVGAARTIVFELRNGELVQLP